MAEGTGIGAALGIGSETFTTGLSNTVFWLQIILGVVFIGAIIWFLLHIMKYKHRVVIFERRANNVTRLYFDKAKEVKENNTTSLKLFRLKYKIPRLDGQKYTFLKGKQDVYFFEKVDEDHILPIQKVSHPVGLKTISQDLKFWLFQEWRKSRDRYSKESWWNQHAGTIMTIGGFAIVAVLMLVLLDKISDVSGSLQLVANAMKDIKIAPVLK